MKLHKRNTYQSGADRMVRDHCWHSSASLDDVHVGDTLRVTNKDTLEVVDWEVTAPPIKLSPKEAEAEWRADPFGAKNADAERNAKGYGFFSHVLRNLRKLKATPPQKPSARFISSEVRGIVWLGDEGKCKSCGSEVNLEFDYIIPVAKGGSNTEKNVEVLCAPCNRSKSSRIR